MLARPQRYGYVVGYDKRNYPKVNWDGLSPNTIYTYHPVFIEKIRKVQKEDNLDSLSKR